jgi:hypothetical protein
MTGTIVLALVGFLVLFLAASWLTIVTVFILVGTMAYGYIDELVLWTGGGAIVLWSLAYWLAPFSITFSYVGM